MLTIFIIIFRGFGTQSKKGVCKTRNPPGTYRNLPEPPGTTRNPTEPTRNFPGTLTENQNNKNQIKVIKKTK